MKTDTPKTIFLKDYQPPHYNVRHADLRFEIFDDKTVVYTTLQMAKNHAGDEPLFLNGTHLKFIACKLDGKEVDPQIDSQGLTLPAPGKDAFTLETVVEIDPATNTALDGLYLSNGTWCTQCEPEGFRRITYYPDRPDNMATFRVRVEADKTACPVLLSNGNLIEQGDLDGGRHFTVWEDPTPKPSYLFAVVAGDLVHIHDTFTTRSGNEVDLYIYVHAGDEDQCGHAMTALKNSMKWDEDVYGREYQYNRFNIVAVSDYNMGAMENTSLNIFNTALVLADPETATDANFLSVEAVIGHEYFHNWTGNRVTCRDWFQLSLKEGLTVFRDQEFSSDMNSRSVQRIDDVCLLRKHQFPEDAGPLAHPIRPDNYIQINNFYTTTVYDKGAEVIRMFRTLLGEKTYRKATDLYFDRFDGQAVTCDDWFQCMVDASGMDLGQFKLWYSQAGTPQVQAMAAYDEAAKKFTLTLKQTIPDTPGQKNKKPMHIPVAFGLLGPNGDDLIETTVLNLKEPEQVFTFENIASKPVPSILRNFSAPVKLKTDLTDDDLRFLMVHDSDGFNRWESGQSYALRVVNAMLGGDDVPDAFMVSYGALLDKALDESEDKALMARAITLPSIQTIAQEQALIDPALIKAVRDQLLLKISKRFSETLQKLVDANRDEGEYSVSPASMGRRALKNAAMALLYHAVTDANAARLKEFYDQASNMTDRMAALSLLVNFTGAERNDALLDFYERFKAYPLVVDKWFSVQAMAVRDDQMEILKNLKNHPDFTLKNPNRVRSLYSAFAMNNIVEFHRKDGSGYDFLKEVIIQLNTINPQIAARQLTPFKDWRRYTPDRQEKMRIALEEILAQEKLSPDVYEIASKSLA